MFCVGDIQNKWKSVTPKTCVELSLSFSHSVVLLLFLYGNQQNKRLTCYIPILNHLKDYRLTGFNAELEL